MTPLVLIVEWRTPDLLKLCTQSLQKFAPGMKFLVVTGGAGPQHHARALMELREQMTTLKWTQYDPVIFLDTDVVICSKSWWPTLERAFGDGHDLVGGHRSRGEACQMFWGHTPLLHASMLAMRRSLFDFVPNFTAEPKDEELGCVTRDTAWQVSLTAKSPKVLPYFPVTKGPNFTGLQVGEYYDPALPGWQGITLWSHLWRGTGMPPGGPVRQAIRAVRAACGSPYAVTVQRAQQRKADWMRRACEVIRAG